jgi:hypothetical protein
MAQLVNITENFFKKIREVGSKKVKTEPLGLGFGCTNGDSGAG